MSPNLNAFAERFVLSIKSECLNDLIIFSEAQLRRVVTEYVAHYHEEGPHQGVGNVLLSGAKPAANQDGHVVCDERLGGLLKSYRRQAA
jgi:putative transposase